MRCPSARSPHVWLVPAPTSTNGTVDREYRENGSAWFVAGNGSDTVTFCASTYPEMRYAPASFPAGPAGQKSYALLHDVMKEKNRMAVGTIVLSGHDETVLVRPIEELLTMKLMVPPNAMLLIRYSWVELLNLWNWLSAPFWS